MNILVFCVLNLLYNVNLCIKKLENSNLAYWKKELKLI